MAASHIVFYTLMALTSVVAIAKLGTLAAILSPEDFSRYSATFALVTFTCGLISFGLVEGTVKKFTRLIAFGRSAELRVEYLSTLRQLTLRHFLVLLLAATLSAFFQPDFIVLAPTLVLLAYVTNSFSIVSSVLRGYDRLLTFGTSALVRATCALLFASLGAALFGWKAALLADAAATGAVCLAYLIYIWGLMREDVARPSAGADDQLVSRRRDGVWLFVAFTVALIPVSFDRLWLVYFSTPTTASQYAFTSLWMSAATMLVTVYIQKLGPELIRSYALRRDISPVGTAIKRSAMTSLLIAAGAACSLVVVKLVFADIYWDRYSMSLEIAIAVVAVSALQITPIYDWALISADKEIGVFAAAAVFAAVAAVLFVILTIIKAGAVAYLAAFGVARLCQILTAVIWMAKSRERRFEIVRGRGLRCPCLSDNRT